MQPLYWNITGFIFCASIIIFSGTRLSYYADRIASLTGLGKAWVGLVLMASVTSIPEMVTGISAVTIVKAPDLAAGDIFGSCIFNLFILSILDIKMKRPILSEVKPSHIVAAIFSIISLTIAGTAIYLANDVPTVLWISSSTFVLFAIYLVAVWAVFKYDHRGPTLSVAPVVRYRAEKLTNAILAYACHAIVVTGAALFLPYLGENISTQSGIGQSFFATLFLAAATSLPELVVSMAAMKMGSLDLAVGNLLGSNLFNIFILAVDDLFYLPGSIYQNISPGHLLSVFTTISMTSVVGLGLLFRPTKKYVWVLSIDTFIIIFLYLLLIIYLFIAK